MSTLITKIESMTETRALMTYFKLPMQTASAFAQELKGLSVAEKSELAQLVATELGVTIKAKAA